MSYDCFKITSDKLEQERQASAMRRPRARPPDVSPGVQCVGGDVLTAGNAVSGSYLRCAATSTLPQLKPRGFSGGTMDVIRPMKFPGEPESL